MTVSDTPWGKFSQSDYTDAQWARACLIDAGVGEGKQRYKLPVREPSGALNRNGVHAAAGRLNQVDASAEKKATAARALVAMYRNDLKEDPPESLMAMAHRSLYESCGNEERIFTSIWSPKMGVPVELRAAGNISRDIGGYAALFNRYSENLGSYVEQVAPSFFNNSRAEGYPGVVCRYNHEDAYMLGSTRGGTLKLSIDETGLLYTVDVPQCRGDVLELVSRGDVANSSFAFIVTEQEWGHSEQGYPKRTLVSGKLIDVAPVTVPAYRDTTVALRGLAEYMNIPYEDVVELNAQHELRKLWIRTDNNGAAKPKHKPISGRQALAQILAKRPNDPIGKLA